MAASRVGPIIRHLRRSMLRHDEAGMTDGQLLGQFVTHRDEAAFEALVRRHGPMVLGVCRRLLRDPHDAEDAFQATFLVLAQKAASVSPREMVGNWLYGVAHTTAIRARAADARRRVRERQVADMPEPQAVQEEPRDELTQLLDEELARLPDKYRMAVVLCDLEGRARREVARQLKVPEGTLSSRLTTARRMLARRLGRRGMAISGGALALAISHGAASCCVPASLVLSTVKAATLAAAGPTAVASLVSAKVFALTEGVMRTMLLTKLKIVSAMLLVAAALGGTAGLIYQTRAAERPEAEHGNKASPARKAEAEGLEGTWKAVSLEVEGKRQDSDALLTKQPVAAIRWVFTGGNKIKIRGGDTAIEATYTRDTLTAPRKIDLTFHVQEGDVEERATALGIYRLDGDTLKVCFILDPQNVRPLRFDVKDVKGTNYYTFRREGSPGKKAAKEDRRDAKDGGKPESDKKRLQGTWKIVTTIDDGQERKAEEGTVDVWAVKETTVLLRTRSKSMSNLKGVCRFRLDETTRPKRIDMVEPKEPEDLLDLRKLDEQLGNGGERAEGIYSVEGDTLKICVSRKKGERPTAFESKKGSGNILWVFQRERPKEAEKKAGLEPEKNREAASSKLDGSEGSIKVESEPPKYRGIFLKMLGVVAERFEQITYANQYDGRIEARAVDAGRSGITREAIVRLQACDDGGLSITVTVNIVVTVGDKAEVVGRDTDLEQAIVRMDTRQDQKGSPSAVAPAATAVKETEKKN
jgi:RNA polymerase sigma factor (sigma-70 family)